MIRLEIKIMLRVQMLLSSKENNNKTKIKHQIDWNLGFNAFSRQGTYIYENNSCDSSAELLTYGYKIFSS